MSKLHTTGFFSALRSALIKAQKSIYISIYVTSFNIRKRNDKIFILFLILQQKLSSGIDIRFLIDAPRLHKTNYHATQFLIRRLKTWHFPFWISPRRITNHAKLILIDQNLLFVGSHNLTKVSVQSPLEVSIETRDKGLCLAADAWFKKSFQDPEWVFYPPGEYKISDVYP